jgi:hypothetical protein
MVDRVALRQMFLRALRFFFAGYSVNASSHISSGAGTVDQFEAAVIRDSVPAHS